MLDKDLDKDAEKILLDMVGFMKNTNDILARFKMRMDNLQIDIDKLNKHKNNGRLILTREG